MVIEDMVYLIHVGGLAEHVKSSLSSEAQLHFVDLEHDPPEVGPCCRLLSMLSRVQSLPSMSFVVHFSSLVTAFFHCCSR